MKREIPLEIESKPHASNHSSPTMSTGSDASEHLQPDTEAFLKTVDDMRTSDRKLNDINTHFRQREAAAREQQTSDRELHYTELKKFANIPAITGNQEILAAIRELRTELKGDIRDVSLEIQAANSNNSIRIQNSRIIWELRNIATLSALRHSKTNQPIPNFPTSLAEINGTDLARLEQLLRDVGIPTPSGTIEDKRMELGTAMGLTWAAESYVTQDQSAEIHAAAFNDTARLMNARIPTNQRDRATFSPLHNVRSDTPIPNFPMNRVALLNLSADQIRGVLKELGTMSPAGSIDAKRRLLGSALGLMWAVVN